MTGSYDLDQPYDVVGAKYGIDRPPELVDYGIVTGPGAELEIQSATQRQIVWGGPLNASSGWVTADLHEELSELFTRQQAIARGDAQAENAEVGSDPLQFWHDYSPRTIAEITSRTQPIKFYAQRVSYQIQLPSVPKLCPGEYFLVLSFKEWGTTETEPEETKTITEKIVIEEGGSLPTTWPTDGSWKPYPFDLTQGRQCKLVSATLSPPSCSSATPGAPQLSVHSVDISISLGLRDTKHSAGSLLLRAETISAATFTPAALGIAADASIEVIKGEGQILRQIKAPDVFVDIVPISTDSFEIRCYRPNQVGVLDAATHLYTISGPAVNIYTISNPDSGNSTDRLRFTDGNKTTDYWSDGATHTTTMSQLGGDRVESVTKSPDGLTEDRIVKDGAGAIIAHTTDTYVQYGFGRALVKHVDGTGAAYPEQISYSYYTDASLPGSFGRLKSQNDPWGKWTDFSYDEQGRILKEVTRFGQSNNHTDASNRVVDHIYTTVGDLDGDGIDDELDTAVDSLLGSEVGRTFELRYSHVEDFNGLPTRKVLLGQATAPGASWYEAGTLVTLTRKVSDGDFKNEVVYELRPDGVLTTTAHVVGSGVVTTTLDTGVADEEHSEVVDGTRTVTQTDSLGRPVEKTTTDIKSGVVLDRETVSESDEFGRPTRLDYLDGTVCLRTYACCGLESETSRDGTVTNYDYDQLGRLVLTSSEGLTTLYDLDAAGRVLKRKRRGSDGSDIVLETNTYDSAGHLLTKTDASGRLTTVSQAYYGTSTVYPDGGTLFESHYPDGTGVARSGSATALFDSVNGVDSAGQFEREYHRTEDYPAGSDASELPPLSSFPEWISHYVDFAGRPSFDEYPDNTRFQRFYNAKGQLDRTVDADGVQTLFAYNALGEQTVVAIDLNRNGVIDYGGSDRVTRTTSEIASRSVEGNPVNVRRITTEVWETDGADAPVTVSAIETSLDGRDTWQTVDGLTTHMQVIPDGTGGRTETTTHPDGSQEVQVYLSGRMQATLTKDSNGDTLASVTYDYDPHGRVSAQTVAGLGTTTYTYFDDDRVHTVTTPDPDTSRTGDGYDPQTTTYGYDAAGRVETVTQPDGGVSSTSYYPTGKVKRSWGTRTYPVEYTYDRQNRLLTMSTWKDFTGNTGKAVTQWTYDPARGWLGSKRDAANAGPSYAYWPSGRLKQRTSARTADGQPIVTTYTYSDAGDLASVDYSDATPGVSQTYDRRGRVSSITDAAGTCTYTYHSSDHVATETYGSSGLLAGMSLNRTYDDLDRASGISALDAQSSPLITTTYGYDSASRVKTITSGSTTVTYGYLADSGLIGAITFQQSGTTRLTTTKTYDHLNRLSSVSNQPSASNLAPIAYSYAYNAANQRVRATREDDSYWNYSYDPLGQIIAATRYRGDAAALPGQDFAYAYDDIGNRRTATVNGRASTYIANNLNQYTLRTVPGVVPVLGRAAEDANILVNRQPVQQRLDDWFYHEAVVDNSTSAQDVKLTISGLKPAAGPNGEEVVAAAERKVFVPRDPELLVDDADGNLTSDGRWVYTWDAENRLVAMETRTDIATLLPSRKLRIEFAYDARGRRISKLVKTWTGSSWTPTFSTRFLYDGWNLVAELDALVGGAAMRTYVWGLDLSNNLQGAGGVGGLLSQTTPGADAMYYFCYDGNGNVTASVSGMSGELVHETDYGVFGEQLPRNGATTSPFGFSTKYLDAETGLLYYGLRYYCTSTGRWLSRDPIEEDGGANLYGMVGNDPLNFVDVLGLFSRKGLLRAFCRLKPCEREEFLKKLGKSSIQFFKDDGTNRRLLVYEDSTGSRYTKDNGYFGGTPDYGTSTIYMLNSNGNEETLTSVFHEADHIDLDDRTPMHNIQDAINQRANNETRAYTNEADFAYRTGLSSTNPQIVGRNGPDATEITNIVNTYYRNVPTTAKPRVKTPSTPSAPKPKRDRLVGEDHTQTPDGAPMTAADFVCP